MLLAALPDLAAPAGEEARYAVDQARILCDAGMLDRVAPALRPVPDDHPHLGVAAHVLSVGSAHGAHSRARYTSIAASLLQDVTASKVPLLPEVLDALLMGGRFADAAEIAERYGSFSAARGSRWRAAQLGLQAFRARAAMGRQRPADLRAARQHLQTLLRLEDHRRAAAGLQWLSRALAASGDPRSALTLHATLGSSIDAHGVWAVRHMARLDRARAHGLAAELDRAWVAHGEYQQLRAKGPRLPEYVGAFDALLLALLGLDGERMTTEVEALADSPGTHGQLAALLAPLADRLCGRAPRPVPRMRRAGGRMLQGLVEAWVAGDVVALQDAQAALRQAPEWRSIALAGVVLRAADKAAERALDQGLVAE